ncbi:MAG: hypothetical protein V4580_07305 [Bacteroidota bacterium]
MSNPNKHKPLSPEELFKLLDNPSSKANDFDELDDFEKEALEGFSAHVDSKTAQTLTEELNTAISQKVSGADVPETKKNKVIWFSAAASLVIIIMISVFFFNQSKKESQTNIVLNERAEDKTPVLSPAGTVPPLEPSDKIADDKNVAEDRADEFVKRMQTEGPKTAEKVAEITDRQTPGFFENNPVLSEVIKEESKNRTQNTDELKKQDDAFTYRTDSKDKSKNSDLEQEAIATDGSIASGQVVLNSAPQSTALQNANAKGVKQEDSKMAEEKSIATKKSAEKQKATKEPAQPDNQPYGGVGFAQTAASTSQVSTLDKDKATSTTSSGKNASSSAYFLGSELAIRDVVLTYFKNKSIVTPVGKYTVKGIVDTKGKLKVTSLIKLSKEDCKCAEDLERALNSMKKWNPATSEGKSISSNVEFVLAF